MPAVDRQGYRVAPVCRRTGRRELTQKVYCFTANCKRPDLFSMGILSIMPPALKYDIREVKFIFTGFPNYVLFSKPA